MRRYSPLHFIFQTIDLHQVAPMCRLQLLDLRGNPKLYSQEHCRCQVLVTWIKRRQGDNFKLFPEFDSICKNTTEGRNIVLDRELCFDNETNLLLEEGDMIASSCESEVMKYGSGPLRLRGSVAWTVIAIAVCASVLVLFSGLYCFRRRHQARQSARDNAPAHGKGWRTWHRVCNACGIVIECLCQWNESSWSVVEPRRAVSDGRRVPTDCTPGSIECSHQVQLRSADVCLPITKSAFVLKQSLYIFVKMQQCRRQYVDP